MGRISIFFSVLTFIAFSIYGQSQEISGTVYAFNKYPLKNVIIKAKKSKQQAVTDEKGNFKIVVKKKDVLQIEAKTFEKYVYRLKDGEESIRLNLIYQDSKKNRGLAIEGGYIQREDLEYGLEHLASENNAFNNFVDIFDAVHYALPAVSFFVENGVRKMMIRGQKSIAGSSAALTLIDGVVVDDISFLNPSEVVSIAQLSSAQAAIYGSRGGNGVIVITTK